MGGTARLVPLDGLVPEKGLCWTCPVRPICGPGDSEVEPQRSTLRLFEEGREVGPAHSLHDEIRDLGRGRFSHWGGRLYLSPAAHLRPDQCRYAALIEPVEGGSGRAI